MNIVNVNFSEISQDDLKKLAAQALSCIQNPESGIGSELFDTIIKIVPQPTVEAVVVDNIDNPTKVWLTPRHCKYYQNSVHCPGSFVRYGETFEQDLCRLIKNELGVKVKRFKDTSEKYNIVEQRRHIIGFIFLVEVDSEPETGKWFNHIPHNLLPEHKNFIGKIFGWKE